MLIDAVTFSDSDQKTLFLLLLQLGIEKLQIKSLQKKLNAYFYEFEVSNFSAKNLGYWIQYPRYKCFRKVAH